MVEEAEFGSFSGMGRVCQQFNKTFLYEAGIITSMESELDNGMERRWSHKCFAGMATCYYDCHSKPYIDEQGKPTETLVRQPQGT